MNKFFNLLAATATVSESDKKVLTFVTIIAVILLIGAALIGTAIRATMKFQERRADAFMYNVYLADIVKSPAEYRKFGAKKNARVFFKQSLIPFLVIAVGVLIWVICCWIFNTWTDNIFEQTKDLLWIWDFGNDVYYVKVFGFTLLSEWPALINEPHIVPERIPAYIETILIIGGIIAYLVASQAWLSRAIKIHLDSNKSFTHTIEDAKKAKEAAMAAHLTDSTTPPPAVD